MAWNVCEPEAGKYSQKCVDPSAHRVGVKGEGKVARQDRKQRGDTRYENTLGVSDVYAGLQTVVQRGRNQNSNPLRASEAPADIFV